jgi:hypothetical protein
MKLRIYILFAFLLCQAYASYSNVAFNSQVADYKSTNLAFDNKEEIPNGDKMCVERELNEEDDAKCCRYNLISLQLLYKMAFCPILGKIITSCVNVIFEPPCII